ncbi:hypothetical protein ACJMK2_011382 [Sinanodonta woodiana]|uniref:Kazal-like domain-containing protein n=1 Tax=Sinanodonta woodiana TaxID=1069815 RepID=A0ABD3V4V9_SINWO
MKGIIVLCLLVVAATCIPVNLQPGLSHCSTFCPMYYMPFCASDGHTYGNECFMRSELCMNGLDTQSVKFVHPGPCEQTSTDSTPVLP